VQKSRHQRRDVHRLKWAAVLTLFIVLGGAAAFEAVEEGQGLDLLDGVWWAV
jgi:hypothetical protein